MDLDDLKLDPPKRLAHLPLVMDFIRQTGVPDIIDAACGIDRRMKASHGECVCVILAGVFAGEHGLWRLQDRLDVFDMATVMQDPGFGLEEFHDVRLGRCLDALYRGGPDRILSEVSVFSLAQPDFRMCPSAYSPAQPDFRMRPSTSSPRWTRCLPGYPRDRDAAMSDRFYDHPIAFQDVDGAGVVFYANLFSIAHRAYEAVLARRGLDLARVVAEADHLLPVVHAEADFFHPLRHGEDLRIAVSVPTIERRSYRCRMDFFTGDPARAPLHASVTQIHVCVDRAEGTAIPIAPAVREVLEGLAGEKEGK